MGNEIREDDSTIADCDRLFRRVTRKQLTRDQDGSIRPTSAVFSDDELSVNIESLMVEQGRRPEESLCGYEGMFLVAVTAGAVRACGPEFRVIKESGPEHDPAHGMVLGKKTGRFKKAMVRAYEWIVSPPSDLELP